MICCGVKREAEYLRACVWVFPGSRGSCPGSGVWFVRGCGCVLSRMRVVYGSHDNDDVVDID